MKILSQKFNNILENNFVKLNEVIQDTNIFISEKLFIPIHHLIEIAHKEKLKNSLKKNFPFDIEGKWVSLFLFTWNKLPNKIVSIGYYTYDYQRYYIWYKSERQQHIFICSFISTDLKQSINDFLHSFFQTAGLDYLEEGIWGSEIDYEPDKKLILCDLIEEDIAKKYYSLATNYLLSINQFKV